MLVSAVLDPSVFDARYFDELYMILAVDFLKAIEKNGLLIVDSKGVLQYDIRKRFDDEVHKSLDEDNRYPSIPIKYRQRLQKYIEELLLKKKSKRIISCPLTSKFTSSDNLLELVCNLRKYATADVLVVGDENYELLRFHPKHRHVIVPLSKFRDSDIEKDRQIYCEGLQPIDTLSETKVKSVVTRLVRFTKRLRFYDAYIGSGKNTSGFCKGIEFILSLWFKHGFFASQQGIGEVEIYTCNEHVSKDNLIYVNRKIKRELMDRLKNNFPHWWKIKLFVKDDPNSIFHARYLETDHAIVRVDRGFDLYKSGREFHRNFISLNSSEGSHLEECQNLRTKREF